MQYGNPRQNGEQFSHYGGGFVQSAVHPGFRPADIQKIGTARHSIVCEETLLNGCSLERIVEREAQLDQLPALRIAEYGSLRGGAGKFSLHCADDERDFRTIRAHTIRTAHSDLVQPLRNGSELAGSNHTAQKICEPGAAKHRILQYHGALIENVHEQVP